MTIDRKNAPSADNLPGGALIEPKGRLSQQKIDAMVKFRFGHPDYPLPWQFEDGYRGSDKYERKYSLAVGLISHPDYANAGLRFLVNNFVPLGETPTPEGDILRQHLQYRVREELLRRGDPKEKRTAEDDLQKFAGAAARNDTPDAQEFRTLVNLFGSSRVVDILYKSRPEFRGIPVDRVKGVLADYLGDVLLVKGGFKIDDIEPGLQYLSDPNLKEGLVEVIKDSCLTICQQEKKKDPSVNIKVVIRTYLDGVLEEASKFENVDLDEVALEVDNYFDSMFKIQTPPNMVDQLKPGRDFPDIGQLINIKEIEDKKRFVEADDMGLGKSAPPVFVKERQGIKTAVVVAPASVVNDPNTWQTYLSSKVDSDGKQRGYFKEGKEPKVLVVNSLDQLKKPDPNVVLGEGLPNDQVSPEDYDYILISQERLTKPYTEALLDVDYGMLIVDEVHRLKKLSGGVRAGNLLKLAEKVEGDDKYLVLLSGTPVPNKVEDVGMILKLLYPDQFRDMSDKALVRSIIRGEYIDLRSLLIPRMQTKNIQDSLDLPPLTEEVVKVELSEIEKEIYGVLLEDDEIEAKEKIRILRQFLLNPDLLSVTPGVESSKVKALSVDLRKKLDTKDRVVVFFSDYIEGVLRGDNSVVSQLDLPEAVEVRVIHGETSQRERDAIAEEFRTTDKKIVLCVSGGTVEVGNDFSRGQAIGHYNSPWTRYQKNQRTGRVYREGVEDEITSTTFVAEETIEVGIEEYTLAKFKAIEKLLKGIPITEIEQGLLEKSEDEDESGLEVNPELAEYYFSAWDRMRKIFGYVKEIGEADFKKFLADFGQDYAQCYVDLGSRSYQANADRVAGTLIDLMAKEKGQKAEEVRILDVASGPEMLRRHIADDYASRVVSVDINPLHFTQNPEAAAGDRAIGSFLKLPFAPGTFDYVNMSLAWHYANFVPSRDQIERLDVLRELHRVLDVGGRAVINSIYSLNIRDEDKLKEVVETVGFRIVPEYTGEATGGRNYLSTVYTLEKVHDLGWTTPEVMQLIGKENHDGLKFRRNDAHLRDTRRILSQFDFGSIEQGSRSIPVVFNEDDQKVLEEEQAVLSQGEGLKTEYGTIADIPRGVVVDSNFIRVKLGKRYALFRRLQTAGGVVVIK